MKRDARAVTPTGGARAGGKERGTTEDGEKAAVKHHARAVTPAGGARAAGIRMDKKRGEGGVRIDEGREGAA